MARKMKDSGIEWIGEIPEGWSKNKVIRLFDIIGSGTTPKNITSDFPVVNWIQSGDITGSFMPTCKNVISANLLSQYSALKVYPAPFIIIAMYGASVGNASISLIDGCVNQACCVLSSPSCNLHYAFYVIKSAQSYLVRKAVGGGQPNISQETIKQLWLPLPPLSTQDIIVRNLDATCSKIDDLLSSVHASIEEYKKLKQAVITQAVTKGVRGEREMKDSGVGWIGAIPKDWEIKRLKSFCTIVDCKNRTPDVFPDGKYTVVRTTCIKDCSFSYEGSYQTDTTNFKAWTLKGQPHKGDIFFTREAPVGEACLVPNADNLCMGQRVMFFRPEDNSDARYIMYSIYGPLVREYIASKNSGSTVGHLKLGQVACIPIFYCPPLEQKEIADYLDAKCAEIAGLIAKKEQLVKELENYKKSLIYEVVTGKREV